jgi:putative membrane protein
MPERTHISRIFAFRLLAAGGGLVGLSIALLSPVTGMARDLFAAHVLQHLLMMNVAGLLIAASLRFSRWQVRVHRKGGLAMLSFLTALQLAALCTWHTPAVFAVAHHSFYLNVLMQLSLFAVALSFWAVVFDSAAQSPWPPILALLITAKVFCLLGAVFIFSRRTFYAASGKPESWGFSALEDQQLAGLLMAGSCGVIYVAAAIVLFSRWLISVEALRGALATRIRGAHVRRSVRFGTGVGCAS